MTVIRAITIGEVRGCACCFWIGTDSNHKLVYRIQMKAHEGEKNDAKKKKKKKLLKALGAISNKKIGAI
jgi:Zn-finger protein